MKSLAYVLSIAFLPSIVSAANTCALPETNVAAGTTVSGLSASGVQFTARISIGQAVSGQSTSTSVVLGAGLQNTSLRSYAYFMSTDAPLGVSALPGTMSVQSLVPTGSPIMTL